MSKIIRLKECNPFCIYRRRDSVCVCTRIISTPHFNSSHSDKADFFLKQCGLPSIPEFYEIERNINKFKISDIVYIYPNTTTWYV